ncbi:hypothetical protein NDU88_006450 [Pleurodeles waltl]|uniref:Uncharacterized protein n=1 Tax=Pleurodeles waltl TaxID=8319 RepID=A0AAV7NTI4_PLEWA|nr:hypothetical protein NDU88_006450 [Pleurodeles waltl]
MLPPIWPPPPIRGSHQRASTVGSANPATESPIRPEGPPAKRHASPSPARTGLSPSPLALHGGGKGANFTVAAGRTSVSAAPPGQQDAGSAVLKEKCSIEASGRAEHHRVPAILLSGKLRPAG